MLAAWALLVLLVPCPGSQDAPAPEPVLWLPRHFSDHMVLQREAQAPLWGRAQPGAEVVVRAGWGTEPLRALADRDGRWRVTLATGPAGGPYSVEITSGSGRRTLEDVLLGDVWLAAGQSNMEMTLGPGAETGPGVEGWQEAVRTAADPGLRFFDVTNVFSPRPLDDVGGEWRAADSNSAPAFSALAYFFARRLRSELEAVPIGVLTADWGGTPAECWMSAQGLGDFPVFASTLARAARLAAAPDSTELELAGARREWFEALAAQDASPRAMDPALDDGAWRTVELPRSWEQQGLDFFDGVLWYRRAVELGADWLGQDLALELGPIADSDETWWNGIRVGGLEDRPEAARVYRLPAASLRAGTNLLAVRVLDTGGTGGFQGGPGCLALSGPAGRLSLEGTWRWNLGVSLARTGPPPDLEHLLHPRQPAMLYNGMIAPLVPLALRGVIWNQGESNRVRAEQYRHLFPALIRDWRAHFGRELPFYFVQSSPFAYEGDTGQAARLRDAQREALALPGTGLAVGMDVGEADNVHPARKRELGERLALWALARTYGRTELECSGPLYRSLRVEPGRLRLEFEHARGLRLEGDTTGAFTLAGADRLFHPAQARVEGETLVVWSSSVAEPLAVRYAWGAADPGCLWNAAGLPAACFRSDDWPEPDRRVR